MMLSDHKWYLVIECRAKCPALIHECWTCNIFYGTMSDVRWLFRSVSDQTMKFGQLKEYNKRNIFLRKLYGKWGIETFLKKPNMRWKQVVCSLVAIYFDISQLAKSKLYKTLDCRSRDMLNFNFSGKGLGLVSPSHLYMIFQEKCFTC